MPNTMIAHRRVCIEGPAAAHAALPLESLVAVESEIKEAFRETQAAKKVLCLALAKINREKLYRQAGVDSFKAYLKAERIPLHYHTAHEYARIGEAILRYSEELEAVDFGEADGLKKLLLLDFALSRHEREREVVFIRLKHASYREFRRLAMSDDTINQLARVDRFTGARRSSNVEEREEALVLMPSDKEILWFDPDLETALHSRALVAKFRHHMLHAANDFMRRLA